MHRDVENMEQTRRQYLRDLAILLRDAMPEQDLGWRNLFEQMMQKGEIDMPSNLTEKQQALWTNTHKHVDKSVWMIEDRLRKALPDLYEEAVLIVVRAGRCARIAEVPGESRLIRVLNSLRGKRRPKDGNWIKTHDDMAYPYGVVTATLSALDRAVAFDLETAKRLKLGKIILALEQMLDDVKRSPEDREETDAWSLFGRN